MLTGPTYKAPVDARWWMVLWNRLAEWLGLDRTPLDTTDLLDTDPALHFREWDRNNHNRFWA